ncbi:MAG: tetratricopeptide repeat protein [SAR324 cluster bacterium]|nr:tetratricopeptide repeat protein [SAR324 cluster bacterium]
MFINKKILLTSFLAYILLTSCQTGQLSAPEVYYNSTAKHELEQEYLLKKKQNPHIIHDRYILSYILYKNNKAHQALAEIKKIILEQPFNAKYLTLAGQIEFDLKNYPSAIQRFSAAIQYNKTLLNAYYGLALSHYRTGDLGKSSKINNMTLLIDPTYFKAKLLKIKLQSLTDNSTKNYLTLLKNTSLLLKEQPTSTEVIKLMVKLYLNQGQVENAYIALNNFIRKNGDNDQLNHLICSIGLTYGNLAKAGQIVNKLPENSLMRWQCEIETLVASNKFERAYQLFLAKKDLFELNLETRIKEARLLMLIDHHNEALSKLEVIYFDNHQKNPLLNYQLAEIYFRLKNYDSAHNYIQKSISIDHNNLAAKLLNIKILLKLNLIERAEKIFYTENFAPLNHTIIEVQADIFFAKKDYTKAKKFYGICQYLLFQSSVAIKIAQLELIEQNYTKALGILNNLSVLQPDNREIIISLAKFNYILGNFGKTIKVLNRLSDPTINNETGLILGLSYIQVGQEKLGLQFLLSTANNFHQDITLIDSLTYNLAIQKRYEEAIPYLENIISIAPQRANYLNQRLADLYTIIEKNENKKITAKWRYLFR